MATERTPEELTDDAIKKQHVRNVLAAATENYASWIYAEKTDLDPDTCERWINTIWDELRDCLDDEQRLRAILLLLEPAAKQRYREIARGVS